MGKSDIRLRHQLGNLIRNFINRIDAVINVINLTASGQLSVDCLPHHLLVVLHHIRLDRHTVHRRLFENAHIADPDQAHVQRAGNRGCRQRQNIYIFLELLDLLLMRNSEPLFLVNDQQSQILIHHVL